MNTLAVGNYYAGFEWGYNPAFWQGLSEASRNVLFDQMAYYLAQHRVEFDKDVEKAVSAAKEGGMKIFEPDQALTEAVAEFVTADEAVLIENAKSRGIENPEALLADYKRIVDRLAALLADVDHGDTGALTALAKAEIYDKLDRANYGMN